MSSATSQRALRHPMRPLNVSDDGSLTSPVSTIGCGPKYRPRRLPNQPLPAFAVTPPDTTVPIEFAMSKPPFVSSR